MFMRPSRQERDERRGFFGEPGVLRPGADVWQQHLDDVHSLGGASESVQVPLNGIAALVLTLTI